MIYLVSPNEREMLNDAGDRMPLGNLYLSSALKANRFDHKVVDLNHEDKQDFLGEIADVKPELVGLSFMSPTYQQMKELSYDIRFASPDTKIVAGGFHVTNSPDFPAEIIQEYGESKLVNLLTGGNEEFDINRYPIPNRSALPKDRYNYKLEGRKATTMITSRGCPMSCVFCSNFDKTQKRRSLDNIASEINEIKEDYDAVYLLDDTFTLNREYASDVIDLLDAADMKYRIEARADMLGKRLVKKLSKNCELVGLGVESGDNSILKRAGKNQTTDQVEDAVSRLNDYDIKSKGFFIIGLPGETYKTAVKTSLFARKLNRKGMKYADFYPLCPYPGTDILANPDKHGITIDEEDCSKYLNGGKELVVPTHTKDLNKECIEIIIKQNRAKWKEGRVAGGNHGYK